MQPEICKRISLIHESCLTQGQNDLCSQLEDLKAFCAKNDSILPTWVGGLLVGLLILTSGLFSGLTLGLLSLNISELNILIKAKSRDFAKYAKRILIVRKRGNWLLCTLLLGNVAVNAAMTILMDKLFAFNPLISLVISTTIITFFGEILPQAVFSRKALPIGYYCVPLVIGIMAILSPIAWPLGKLFDLILGEEIGVLYNNAELHELIELHVTQSKAELNAEQGRIIQGALNFFRKHVKDVMTPWSSVYSLLAGTKLTFEVLLNIFRMGYSRIPVVNEEDRVIAVLFVKDLILLDPEDETPVEDVAKLYDRELGFARQEDSLRTVLARFSSGHHHMAMVISNESTKAQGIITLEDIVEDILNFEIVDETDIYVDTKEKNLVVRKPFDVKKLEVFDYRRDLPRKRLVVQEINALTRILMETELGKRLTPSILKMLLRLSRVCEVFLEKCDLSKSILEGGTILYTKGEPSEFCFFMLEGKAEYSSDNVKKSINKWQIVETDALSHELDGLGDYIPKHTLRVISDSRVLAINRIDLKEIIALQKQ